MRFLTKRVGDFVFLLMGVFGVVAFVPTPGIFTELAQWATQPEMVGLCRGRIRRCFFLVWGWPCWRGRWGNVPSFPFSSVVG
jgi:hypothetical protein